MATIYCDRRSRNARRIFEDRGYEFCLRPCDADVLWMRRGYEEYFRRLEPFQILNHLPREREVVDKGHLTQHLQAHERRRRDAGLALPDFYPETHCLFDPAGRRAFVKGLPAEDDPENVWILKPTNLSKGRGIRILWQLGELGEALRRPPRPLNEIPYIAQRYIKDPLLLDGRKSEIRVYWLVASLDPLLVFLWREGTARLNTLPFRLDDYDNTLIHVTNVFQQKNHADYDPSVVLKWSFLQLEDYVVESLGLTDYGFIERTLKPRLKEILAFVTNAARKALVKQPATGSFFGLFGADLILDARLRPWLTEVQKGPGLSFSDSVKKDVIPPMLDEAMRLVLEIQERRSRRDSLSDLENLEGFEPVIDESR